MVSLGIATLILAGVSQLYVYGQQNFVVSGTFAEVHGNARLAMDWMSNDLRWTTALVSSKTINSQNYTTGTTQIILNIPAIDGSGNVLSGVSDYIVYHLDPNDATILQRTIDADATSSRTDGTRTIANNIQSLAFSSGGTALSSVGNVTTVSSVGIAVTTDKTALIGKGVNEVLNSIIKLRNK